LPVPYFRLVFTLPHDLNPLIQQNLAPLLKLIDHYHLHVLVTGGGLAPEGIRWVPTTPFYLFRYTHRVALSQRRLRQHDPEHHTVTFTYKDYADHDRVKPLTLSLEEFLRRFRLHLLPPRFVKIRHYGFLSNGQRQRRLAQARALLHAPPPSAEPALTTIHDPPTAPADHRPHCPHCGADALVLVEILYPPKTLRPEDTS
jgi:hypothetical protein